MLATNAAIRAAVPHARIPYFRAPYGSWGATPSVAAGTVVLMHDGGGDRSQTVEAVARTIPLLQAKGYRFTLPAAEY